MTVSDYTPTDNEILTAVVIYRAISTFDTPPPSIDTLASPEEVAGFLSEFRRWLAAHDAEKRAEWEAEQGDKPAPCVMTHTPPFNFAQCETHDETFPLGGACKWHGKESVAQVLQDEADEQRRRAVRAEHQLEILRAEQGETASADGWYEWLTPGMSLTRIAYVYESGRVYFPEGDDVDESDFLLAAARGNVWRLVRLQVPGTTNNESEGKA